MTIVAHSAGHRGLGLLSALLAWPTGLVAQSPRIPPLPIPTANNAVAVGREAGRLVIYSMLGIDSTKRWSGITTRAHRWVAGSAEWEALPPVPGGEGRLAATAQWVRGKVYLFGGYTVSSTGAERSAPTVNIFDPATRAWTGAAPIPVPVDDAVSGVYRDSLVYLVSGWHDTDNVPNVQVYDAVANHWSQATPFPGTPVFGHGGGLVGNSIVIIDGAKRIPGPTRYALAGQAWLGRINPTEPTRITWERLPNHPGPPRYRPAGSSCGNHSVAIVGGTANPYNYNGIGYDGKPSEPAPGGVLLDVRTRRWQVLPPGEAPTMDHRGLVVEGRTGWVIGGIGQGQRVSASVVTIPLRQC